MGQGKEDGSKQRKTDRYRDTQLDAFTPPFSPPKTDRLYECTHDDSGHCYQLRENQTRLCSHSDGEAGDHTYYKADHYSKRPKLNL
jgi:hypothetical protein